jgi:hypothetical protein
MFHLAIFGGNKIDGSTVDPGEQVVGLALFGGLEFDFTQCQAPEGAELMIFAILGGATVKVREEENVMFSGVSLFGGRSTEPKRERYDREGWRRPISTSFGSSRLLDIWRGVRKARLTRLC